MPYFTDEVKAKIDAEGPKSGKELAWCFARDIKKLLDARQLNADLILEIEGALGVTSKDFWDEVGRPYEAKKREQNGKIY